MGDVLAIADSILPSQIRELGNFKLEHTLYGLHSGVKNVWKWSVVNTASKSSWGKQFDTKEEAVAYIKSEISTENTKGESIAKFDRWTERGKPGIVFVGKKIASGKYITLKEFPTSKEALNYTIEHNAELVELLKQKKKDKEIRRAENNQRVGKDYRSLLFINRLIKSLENRANISAELVSNSLISHSRGSKSNGKFIIPPDSVLSDSPSGMDSDLNKSFPYMAAVNLKFLGYLNNAGTLDVQAFSKLDIPFKRLVQSAMLSIGHDEQIRRAVILLIPVDVMNNLAGEKISADNLLSNKSMLSDSLSINGEMPVRSINPTILSFIRAVASVGTEITGTNNPAWVSFKDNSTALTGQFDGIFGKSLFSHNVTPDDFIDAFSFFGVQFGNYVSNDRRQQDLNNAYDGLIDLAEVLGIPPKALALNGELGLAFGARGTGGEKAAAAHYEANQVVINLTKAHGAGSLAHEWWHAVDNYFGKQEGSGFLSDKGPRRAQILDGNKYRESTDSDFAVRKEVFDAWQGITKAIKTETQLAKRSAIKDKTRSKDYYSTVIEMTARTFERYIIGKLADQGYENDYLANIIPAPILEKESELDNEDYAYPLQSEMEAVNKAYDKLFDTLETKETEKGTILFSRSKSTKEGYEQRIDELFSTEKPIGAIKVLDKSDLLDMLGYRGEPLYLNEKKVIEGRFHHGLTKDHWKKIPEWLDDPAMIFDSLTVKGRMVAVAPELVDGKPVYIVLDPNYKLQRLSVQLLVNAYDDNSGNYPFKRWIDEGLLRFENEDKVRSLRTTKGLQLPSVVHAKNELGYKILHKSDLVKYRAQQNTTLNSISTTPVVNPHSKTTLNQAVTKAMDTLFGQGWTNRLMATGKFKMISRDEAVQIAGNQAANAKGFYNSDNDTTYLVHDNIEKDTSSTALVGLMLHEISTHSLNLGKSNEAFQDILRRFEALKATNPKVQAAFDNVPASTPDEHKVEEALAEYLQANPKSSLAQRIVEWFRQAVRALGKTLPVLERAKFSQWANKLTEAELIGMATSALKSAPDSLQFDNVGRNREGIKLSGDKKELLAPNGKPSNLNAMQHAQVRTEAFKKWFGDWLYNPEMEMTPIKLIDDPDMPDLKDTAAIRRHLKGKFRIEKPVTNLQTSNEIGFFVGGLEAALKNRNTQSRRLFSILPEILRQAAYASYEENTKLDTKPYIKGYETYYAVVDIDGKLNSVRIVVDIVKDETRGRGYYYHQISEVDLDGAVGKSRSQSDLSQTNYPAPSGRKITLGQLTGKVNNNASKVVDENGEPLVVYHGTNADFDTFKYQDEVKRYGAQTQWMGFFFANNADFSASFAPIGKGSANLMPVFLNMRSPYHANEADIERYNENNADENETESVGLDKKGYDGIKILDDSDRYQELAVFNPNQIKSATENNGDFSLSNNNIKFSRSTPSNTPADNSAMRSFFAPAKGKQALGWLAGVFQRNHLIDFVAQDLPELINYS
jgi:hypothetical protein